MMKGTGTIRIAVFLSLLVLSACDEDEPLPKAFFPKQTSSVRENEGAIVVRVMLERVASTDVQLNVRIDETSTAVVGFDFLYDPVVTIPAGQSGADFVLHLVNDDTKEETEYVDFTLEPIAGGQPSPSSMNHRAEIVDDDVGYMQIDLAWDSGDGTPGDADLDLVLWIEQPAGSGSWKFVKWSAYIGPYFERLSIPNDTLDRAYGVTVNYYEGSSDHVEFTVTYSVVGGTLDGASGPLAFTGVYTLQNVNCCDPFWIEQTFVKAGFDYSDFSEITIPESGSRMKMLKLPSPKVPL